MSGLLDSLLLAALAALAGAPHCIVMCGGIASSFALRANGAAYRPVVVYAAGKTVTYACAGAVMGAAGSFVNVAGGWVGVQGAASVLGGIVILLWAWKKAMPPVHRWNPLRLRFVDRALSRLRRRSEGISIFATGLLLGFLPCGLTYSMQIQAAATGSWAEGFLLLFVFGAFTIPALLLVGAFAGRIGKKGRRGLRRAGTVIATLMGILSILKGLSANGLVPPVHPWLW